MFKANTFGTFMFSMHVKAAGNSDGPIAIRRNDDDIICNAWVSAGPDDVSSCSAVTHLYFGDKVKVTGSNADTAIIKKKSQWLQRIPRPTAVFDWSIIDGARSRIQ